MCKFNGPRAKRVLQNITGLTDFEESRRDWELVDIIKSEEMDVIKGQYNEIKAECELCGQTSLNNYYIIAYSANKKSITVGSSCITKMILFKGINAQEDSNRFFEKRKTQIASIKSVRELLTDIFLDPVQAYIVTKFRKLCANILNIKAEDGFKGLYLSDSWFKLIDILNQNMPNCKLSEKQENRIKMILFNPKQVEIIKEKIRDDKPVEWRKKTRAIKTTLSWSESFKNPSDIIMMEEKDEESNNSEIQDTKSLASTKAKSR